MQVGNQTRISLLQLHRLFFYFSVLAFIPALVLSLPKVFPVYSAIPFHKIVRWGWTPAFQGFCDDLDDLSILLHIGDMLHILVKHQTSCALSLSFVIFMSDWNLKECFKTLLSLDAFPCTYAKSLLWSSTNFNLRGSNLVMESLVEHLMTSSLTWQGGLEAVKEVVFHRSRGEKFEQGHGKAVSGEEALWLESYLEDKLTEEGEVEEEGPLIPSENPWHFR